MDNREVAEVLQDISRLLELEGADTYRIRAYRKASHSIFALEEDINALCHEGRLQEIPGVGKSIGELIKELLSTGKSQFHGELKKEIPPELFEAMRIPGIGKRTALKIYKALGVSSLDGIEKAARQHRVRNVAGIGAKLEKNILESIENFKKGSREHKVPLYRALAYAFDIIHYLKPCDAFDRIEIAGSIRRHEALVGNINFIAISNEPEKLLDHFCSLPVTVKVIERKGNFASIDTVYHINATLDAVNKDDMGLSMLFATGPEGHIAALERLAAEKGIDLDYSGFVNAVTLERMHFTDEKDIYGSLGIQFIPPELRADGSEVKEALSGPIHEPVAIADIKGDLHVHTDWSDGADSIQSMAIAARARGYEYIAVCDHSRSLSIANGLSVERLREQISEIDRINESLEGFRVLKGCEVDIKADGTLDMPDDVLKELDIVVGSVHVSLRQEPEVITGRVLKAFENEYLTILGHPTSRIIGRRDPTLIDMDTIIEAAVTHGKVLEVNAYPDRLDLSDINVRKAMDAGAMVCINTDAHNSEELGYMEFGVFNARRGRAKPESVLNAMASDKLFEFLETRI
jgi:DNA polymerase (family 10)